MDERVIREVDELVTVGERLAFDASRADDYLGPDRVQELSMIAARSGQLVRKLYGSDSHYAHAMQAVLKTTNFTSVHSNHCRHVSELVGILKGMQQDIKSGLLANFRHLIQAEVFADFLEMAEYLLREGYKDASAVLLGAVLEDTLRKLAESHNLSLVGESGKPLTMEPLNVSLYKAGLYGPLIQKQITSWANLRNDAAHGHFDKYDAAQVQQMNLFVQKFCADYLK